MRSENIFKFNLLLILSCGLIYQVQIIYLQFMSGKTIVSIEIGRRHNHTLPVITICFPELYLMERMAQYDPAFIKINETYAILLAKNKSKEARMFYIETIKIYNHEKLNKTGLDINEIFNKTSIKFKGLEGDPVLMFSLYGNADNHSVLGDFIPYIR